MKTAFPILLIILSVAALATSTWAFLQLRNAEFCPAPTLANRLKTAVLYLAWLMILGGSIGILQHWKPGATLAIGGFGILLLHTLLTGILKIAGLYWLAKGDEEVGPLLKGGITKQVVGMLLVAGILGAILYYLQRL